MAITQLTLGASDSVQRLAELIARIALTDQRALEDFYDQTSPLVYGFVRRIVRNPSLAEEVTLDVFVQVWRNAGRYDEKRATPLSWLGMMARSRAIDSLRSLTKYSKEEPLDPARPVRDLSPSAEDNLAAAGRESTVRAALNSLAAAQREAIELAFYAGLSHSAIAAKPGEPVGTIKSRIRLGMLRLRGSLSPLR